MIKKYCIASTVAIFASLLIVSSTTAVPYTYSNAIDHETEILDIIQKIVDSKQFGNLRRIAEKSIDEETRGEIRNSMRELLINKGMQQGGSQFEILVEFLVAIAEILLALLGHNPIGQGITIAIVGLIALISMILVAIPYTPLVIFDLSILFFGSLTGSQDIIEEIITNFGLIGAALLLILFLPLYLVMVVLSFVPIYILIVVTETLLITDDVFSRLEC